MSFGTGPWVPEWHCATQLELFCDLIPGLYLAYDSKMTIHNKYDVETRKIMFFSSVLGTSLTCQEVKISTPLRLRKNKLVTFYSFDN